MATTRNKPQDQASDRTVIARETFHDSDCGNCHVQASGHDGEPCLTDRRDDIALPCIKERLTPSNLCLTFPSHHIQSSQTFYTFYLAPERNQAEAASCRNPRQAEPLKVSALQAFEIQFPFSDQSGNRRKMDDFFSKPMKLVTLAAAGDAFILAAVWRKWGPTVPYTPAFLRDSYFNSYLVFFWASWWLHFWGWLWYRLILKPKYLSKMRHLPEPTVGLRPRSVPCGPSFVTCTMKY